MNERKSIAQMFDLSGSVALVTGGGRGIGAGIALRLAEAGACTAIVDVDGERAAQTAREIESSGGAAISIVADMSQPLDVARAVDAVTSQRGCIDILVSNAGIFPMAPAIETDDATWEKILDTNLKAPFFLASAVAAKMSSSGRSGCIINIASIAAETPVSGFSSYGISKAGVVMLTKSLALEFSKFGIRVNAVSPGCIRTPGSDESNQIIAKSLGLAPEQTLGGFVSRIPRGCLGEPDDIAMAVLFLASRASSYVTGANLVVDGGYLLS